ncbi:hypothetical protein D9Q98_008369 [Chlorella vulgaris]|uniref:Transcription initiation factor TFIID component TAF4 C-terminal domain-containing protein n=1 Tax=Chlorella vulgaris TaxID=3077 RepID=A0A9D4YT61_CHLVU|nr:hypothetical protein D9Q98_008369 [Chlorella vulgaris]
MDDDDLLGAMLDFGDAPTAMPPPQPARGPVAPQGPSPMPSPSTARPPASPASAVSISVQHYHDMLLTLHSWSAGDPHKQAGIGEQLNRIKTVCNSAVPDSQKMQAVVEAKEEAKRLCGLQIYERAKALVASALVAKQQAQLQAQSQGGGTPASSPAPARATTPAAQQQAQQQQQLHPQQAHQVQVQAQQMQAQQQQVVQQAAARSPSPFPARSPSPHPAAVMPGAPGQPAQSAAQQQQQMQAQLQQQRIQQHMFAQQQQVAAAAKRSAEALEQQAKRAKSASGPGWGGGLEKRKKGEDTGLTVDALIDFDQETNQLMDGLQRARLEGRLQQKTASNQQFLSEWRLGNEFYRHIQRTGGGLGVKGECFELMQLAFQAHLSGVVARALRRAQHRQDAPRRSAEMVVTSDPRRGVTQIERREKVKADAKLEVERAELLRMAGSKRADDETKERAQKAKAELVGKQQASLANAAVAATLGGKSKSKVNKWDKWSSAAAAGTAAGEADGAAPPAKGKKGGAGKKGAGKKGAGAAAAGGESDGGSDASAAAATGGGAAAAAQAPARGRLMGGAAAAAATDDASTVHLQDVLSTLERDPLYSRSGMLYRLYNTPHTSGAL